MLNLSYEEATSERNINLFKFIEEQGKLPVNFPANPIDSFGVICLHRQMLRRYLKITENFESVEPRHLNESETHALDIECETFVAHLRRVFRLSFHS